MRLKEVKMSQEGRCRTRTLVSRLRTASFLSEIMKLSAAQHTAQGQAHSPVIALSEFQIWEEQWNLFHLSSYFDR